MSFRLVAVQMRYISEQSNKIDNYDPKGRCMRWSAVLLKVSELQNGGHPPSWIGCTPIWTTHEEYLVVLFGWNQSCSFDNTEVLLFRMVSLKTPIHAPKIGVLGGQNPINGCDINTTPKRHIIAWKDRISN